MAAIQTTTMAKPGVRHLRVISSCGRTQWNHRWTQMHTDKESGPAQTDSLSVCNGTTDGHRCTQIKNPSAPVRAVSDRYLTFAVPPGKGIAARSPPARVRR